VAGAKQDPRLEVEGPLDRFALAEVGIIAGTIDGRLLLFRVLNGQATEVHEQP
jgi:hypothetical protein